jgi:proteasome lid subunit RPN8/RPN11
VGVGQTSGLGHSKEINHVRFVDHPVWHRRAACRHAARLIGPSAGGRPNLPPAILHSLPLKFSGVIVMSHKSNGRLEHRGESSSWRSKIETTTTSDDEWEQQATRAASLPLLTMTQAVYRHTMHQLGSRPPEAAGILLGPEDAESLVTHFVLDTVGIGTSVSFSLDAANLNDVLAHYRQCRLTCVGIAHSHPAGIHAPSHGDLMYVERVFGCSSNREAKQFVFPIFSDDRLYPFVLARTGGLPQALPAALVLV